MCIGSPVALEVSEIRGVSGREAEGVTGAPRVEAGCRDLPSLPLPLRVQLPCPLGLLEPPWTCASLSLESRSKIQVLAGLVSAPSSSGLGGGLSLGKQRWRETEHSFPLEGHHPHDFNCNHLPKGLHRQGRNRAESGGIQLGARARPSSPPSLVLSRVQPTDVVQQDSRAGFLPRPQPGAVGARPSLPAGGLC